MLACGGGESIETRLEGFARKATRHHTQGATDACPLGLLGNGSRHPIPRCTRMVGAPALHRQRGGHGHGAPHLIGYGRNGRRHTASLPFWPSCDPRRGLTGALRPHTHRPRFDTSQTLLTNRGRRLASAAIRGGSGRLFSSTAAYVHPTTHIIPIVSSSRPCLRQPQEQHAIHARAPRVPQRTLFTPFVLND